VYDVVPVHDYAYVSRRNIIHAYDVIPQPDTATRSGNVTLSVADILSIPEWFFRVNRALKIFEGYIPYELATTSAVPTIYADDLSIIYDLGASINAIKTASAFDKLVVDYATYTKSYSPLFFSLFQRRVPIVFKTLGVMDTIAVSERVDYTKSYNTLFFSLFQRRVPVVYKTLSVLDTVAISERVDYTKSYNALFFSLFQRRVPVVYKTLSVLDAVAVKDGASVIPIKVVSVLDVVPVADRVDVKNIAISVSDYVVYDSASAAKIEVVSMLDVVAVKDSASVIPIRVVSASDFIMYDYVPGMSTSDIKYRSLYANVGMRTISVLDKVVPYESVWVGPRVITVNARDYLVSDGATAIKRSVHAYDVVVAWENVNIVRL
jgi:hypothetical protein